MIPIRFLVNTHLHPDHTFGNKNFRKSSTMIIGQQSVIGDLRPSAI
ncbi:MAG TPA: MBL fold metallo-hydrolase [Gammaproteobacteria bacterium]|nr:MBL fold metallo-hydrolase [Gammaproteobacteria bacterium]HIM04703.1 MBL fold metallo-hydrolase [Gammaproteobacteria bacterium]